MSWISKIFRKSPEKTTFAPGINGFLPIYTQFGQDIYASDAVQQCIKCIVDELKKLNPLHVRQKGNDPVPVKGNIQDILECPNEVMTTSELIEKTMWMLLLNYNAFIIPTFQRWYDTEGEERRRSCLPTLLSAVTPLRPAPCLRHTTRPPQYLQTSSLPVKSRVTQ